MARPKLQLRASLVFLIAGEEGTMPILNAYPNSPQHSLFLSADYVVNPAPNEPGTDLQQWAVIDISRYLGHRRQTGAEAEYQDARRLVLPHANTNPTAADNTNDNC